jgi:uncharacterized protein YdcH (DUF465 family)
MAEVGSQGEVEQDEYHRLVREHHSYEDRLQTLSSKPALTEDEEVEERLLKKKKLHIKDRLESMGRVLHGH